MAISIDEVGVCALLPEVNEIQNADLRRAVIDIWIETGAECSWASFDEVPKSLGAERHRRLIDHVRGVTKMALALAETAQREQDAKFNRDYLLAACLLHDVSKVLETEPSAADASRKSNQVAAAQLSEMGSKLQHAVYATHKVLSHKLPIDVANLVLTHTLASNMRPNTVEGAYLFYADSTDSDVGIIGAGGTPFLQRWRLG
jgi:HD superfamily phosphohydrolase YqeK